MHAYAKNMPSPTGHFWHMIILSNCREGLSLNSLVCIHISPKYAVFIQTRFPSWLSGKNPACQTGGTGLIPGSGRSSREANGNPLQYSCLGNPMDRGAWLKFMGLQRVRHGSASNHHQFSVSKSLGTPVGPFSISIPS